MASQDVVVVGAGPAGLAAALGAAEAGARVAVLAGGVGTTHLAAGTVDVLGYWPPGAADPVKRPREIVARLVEEAPGHPYALVGVAGVEEALNAFGRAVAAQGLAYEGSLDANQMLPTPAGALKPTCLVPRAMAAGAAVAEGRTLIAGFAGTQDFYPGFVAANLRAQGLDAGHVWLDVAAVRARRPQTAVVLASLLDDPAVLNEVIRAVRPHASGVDRIGLPAVLGFRRHPEVVVRLEEAVGVPVFEVPTLPPSVPGFRLFEALRRHLAARRVRITIGAEVVQAFADGDRLVAVGTATASRVQRHPAAAFVLATGGILGGGIVTRPDGSVAEVALGLPVSAPAAREGWLRPQLMHPDGHPIYRAGVRVDGRLRPVTGEGQVVYGNVYAAGAVLAGTDLWREKSHEGVSLATGYRAGRAAAGKSVEPGSGEGSRADLPTGRGGHG